MFVKNYINLLHNSKIKIKMTLIRHKIYLIIKLILWHLGYSFNILYEIFLLVILYSNIIILYNITYKTRMTMWNGRFSRPTQRYYSAGNIQNSNNDTTMTTVIIVRG